MISWTVDSPYYLYSTFCSFLPFGFLLYFHSSIFLYFLFSQLRITNSFKVEKTFLSFWCTLSLPPHFELIICYKLNLVFSYLFYSVVIYISLAILLCFVSEYYAPLCPCLYFMSLSLSLFLTLGYATFIFWLLNWWIF